MTIGDIAKLLECEVLCCSDRLTSEVHTACGSDMMSDVLAFVKDQAVLLTGLLNPQVVRTAEMMDIICIVFVRGKKPDDSVVELAAEKNIAILTTANRMFEACGILYEGGLRGGVCARSDAPSDTGGA
jgi:predicted transcriptional regulator